MQRLFIRQVEMKNAECYQPAQMVTADGSGVVGPVSSRTSAASTGDGN